jgi:hypothetical protein
MRVMLGVICVHLETERGTHRVHSSFYHNIIRFFLSKRHFNPLKFELTFSSRGSKTDFEVILEPTELPLNDFRTVYNQPNQVHKMKII